MVCAVELVVWLLLSMGEKLSEENLTAVAWLPCSHVTDAHNGACRIVVFHPLSDTSVTKIYPYEETAMYL